MNCSTLQLPASSNEQRRRVSDQLINQDYYLPSNLPYWIWKIAHVLDEGHIPVLPFMMQQGLRVFFGCLLPYKTKLGRNVHFAHNGLGTVVHPNCVIGNDVMIYTGVTLGASEVGDKVQIFTGAKVINMVKVGSNVKIGANAVVICDLPDNCIAFGVPARIIKT